MVWGLRPESRQKKIKKKRKKNISYPAMVKGINKCTERDNGHKQRGFYSECYNADESPECTWRPKLRAALDQRARRHIIWDQGVLVIFTQISTPSIYTADITFVILLVFLTQWGTPSPTYPLSAINVVPLVFYKQYSLTADLI